MLCIVTYIILWWRQKINESHIKRLIKDFDITLFVHSQTSTDRSLMKFGKGKCKVLLSLGRANPVPGYAGVCLTRTG